VTDWYRIKTASAIYRAELNQWGGDRAMAIMVATRKVRDLGFYLSDAEWKGVAQSAQMHP
jgi:hypothetical protein